MEENIIKNKLIFIIAVGIIFICIFLNPKENISDKIPTVNATTYYQILDSYGLPNHEKFSEIITKPGIIDKFSELYSELDNAANFKYFEVYKSLLQYQGMYENGDTFIYGYDGTHQKDLHEFINQQIKTGEETILLTNIKGIFIGEKSFNEYLLLQNNIIEGRGFESSDFFYVDRINVILGNDYADLYDVGDSILAHYLGDPMTFNIVGFLKDKSIIDIGDTQINLNSFIVVPSFNITSQDKLSRSFKAMHYSNRTRGIIKINDNADINTALSEFDDLINKLDLDYVYIPIENKSVHK